MSQVIRIPTSVYSRLEQYAEGFDTPANVIEKLLNHFEGLPDKNESQEPESNIQTNNIIRNLSGELINNIKLASIFEENSLVIINKLRNDLINEFPNLCEKVNINSKYFGFSTKDNNDAIYIYLQKNKMRIDINISRDKESDLKEFDIKYKDNFQGQAGWLTGLYIPYDLKHYETIKNLAFEALSY